jgi:hypothetical protein
MRAIDYILTAFLVFSSLVLITDLIIVSHKVALTNYVRQMHELNQNK